MFPYYKFKWLRSICLMLLPRHPELKDWPTDATQKCHAIKNTPAIDSIWRWVTTTISNLFIDGVSIPLFSSTELDWTRTASHRRSTCYVFIKKIPGRGHISRNCNVVVLISCFSLPDDFVADRWCTWKVSFLSPTSVIYPHQFEEAFSVHQLYKAVCVVCALRVHSGEKREPDCAVSLLFCKSAFNDSVVVPKPDLPQTISATTR